MNPNYLLRRITVVVFTTFTIVFLLGCNDTKKKSLQINNIQPSKKSSQREIRIAMTAAFVSEQGIGVYKEICDYLAERLDRKCEFITGMSYSVVNDMLDTGAIDIGFICGLPYVLKQEFKPPTVKLIVAPVMKASHYKNQPQSFSYVIVGKNSKFDKFTDLKGSTYVYNDEISNSGYNMLRAHLIELGETNGFFGKIIRSGSHEESIRMVAEKKADASSVASLVFEFDLKKYPKYAKKVKVIETLGPAGIPPVVASSKMPTKLFNSIQNIFIKMDKNPVGRQILDEALIDKFIIVSDNNYDNVRAMKKLAENAKYLEIR